MRKRNHFAWARSPRRLQTPFSKRVCLKSDCRNTNRPLSNNTEALTTLQQTLADAEAHDLRSWVAQCHDYLGRTYFALNQQPQALEHFQTALALFVDLHNPLEEARVRALIGQVYQTQGKLDEAGQSYQQALKTFDGLDDHIDRSATLFAMGQLEMAKGNYDAAE